MCDSFVLAGIFVWIIYIVKLEIQLSVDQEVHNTKKCTKFVFCHQKPRLSNEQLEAVMLAES